MKVTKLIEKLNTALDENLKKDTNKTNDKVTKYVRKALDMLDSDKKDELLKELTKKKNFQISTKIRENHLLRTN